jgi:hypothetical protein
MIRVLLILAIVSSVPSFAERSRGGLKDWRVMLLAQSDMLFADPDADKISGADYSEKFQKPFIGKVGIGAALASTVYVELSYLHWTANQKYTLGGLPFTNEFRYQALGASVGWISGTPRVFWIIGGGVYYPLALYAENKEQALIYDRPNNPLTFEGRALLGVRLNSLLLFTLSGGYRFANFGSLTASAIPFLSNWQDLDFSGIFGSVGVGISL